MDIERVAELIVAGETSIDIENGLKIEVSYEAFNDEDWVWITLADVNEEDYTIIDTQDTQDCTRDSIEATLENIMDNNEDWFY